MSARKATEADAGLLLAWRNDPRTRQASRSTGVITLDEHSAWLRGVLASPDRELYVVEFDERPVGTVRFDREDDGVWEVSITLAPESRGRGLSGAVLAEGERAVTASRPVRVIVAAVHRDNAASAALFDRAGYAETAPAVDGFRKLRKTVSRPDRRQGGVSSMSAQEVRIGAHRIGAGHPPFVIAEMSGNHNGELERALEIVDAIAATGAQAVKLQTYRPDTITIDVDAPAFRVSDSHSLWGGENLYKLYERAHTPWEWHEPLFERARARGLEIFSSPFDPTAVDLLESLDAPAYKIASSEIVDLPLIELCAKTGKPLIISTGMASVAEIDAAVRTAREAGNDQLIVLGCTASYPASPSESNLRGLPVLAGVTGTLVGLSDHTPGIGAPLAAVALGAVAIEKHVTLARSDGGVDSEFSLEPAELAALVTESHRAWEALGAAVIGPRESEKEGLRLRRSLYVVEDVRAGDTVTRENVRSIRPAGGLAPAEIVNVLGRTFASDVPKGTALTWGLI